MTLSEAITQADGVGVSLSNSTIINACEVLASTGSTQSQKESACNTLVSEHNNNVIETAYAWTFYDAVEVIHDTVNPNGPVPDRPH